MSTLFYTGCVFSKIWNTHELITSMDAIIAWKLWQGYNPYDDIINLPPRPRTEGLHLDQNPFTKIDLDCVQGMMPLLPVTKEIGGLQVVPFSHTNKNKTKF